MTLCVIDGRQCCCQPEDGWYCDAVDKFKARMHRAETALSKIMWIKDIGVDTTDEHGVFRNHPETERDAMYDIARIVLDQREVSPDERK
jgi:uncharacterized protein YegJ (DUF2314 family)